MATVLVTGANGQVGRELQEELLTLGHKVVALGHKDLDITDENSIASLFESLKLDLVVNSAAYTAVDKAEDEEQFAYAVNALGPKYLAKTCKSYNIPLIHISTDYVYDTKIDREHNENDSLNTNCAYGKTKLFGERFIKESGCDYVILRASWIFGRFGKNFVKAMVNLSQTRDTLNVVSDEVGNPTPARALAHDICQIGNKILEGNFKDFGIYNYCAQGPIARNEFAKVILAKAQQVGLLDHDVTVNAITQEQFGAKAQRPKDARMNTSKFERTFNIKLPLWQDYLEETMRV